MELASPDELFRAHYYHCASYRSDPPTQDEAQRYASRLRFFTALSHLDRFDVRLGRLAYRGVDRETGKRIFIQKRVDCMVGVDMALLAAKGKIERVVLLSGDSDLIPAIEAVKRESILVTLWHGPLGTDSTPSRDLFEICDERKEVSRTLIESIRR